MRGFLLVFTLGTAPRASADDPWFAADKVQHFFTSAFVQSMTYGSLRAAGVQHGTALAGATAMSAAAGIGKELHDLRGRGDPSVKDLVWDAAGAGAATLLLVKTAR
ncbi:MAG: yfiM [Gemmatimonadetes bacterium]|jgi:uncharacterized protein YfiM (DUF2279 family)|nr:yfiM [Gemmatimonadota bacterium]